MGFIRHIPQQLDDSADVTALVAQWRGHNVHITTLILPVRVEMRDSHSPVRFYNLRYRAFTMWGLAGIPRMVNDPTRLASHRPLFTPSLLHHSVCLEHTKISAHHHQFVTQAINDVLQVVTCLLCFCLSCYASLGALAHPSVQFMVPDLNLIHRVP